MSKIGMIGIQSKPTTRLAFHNAGHTYALKSMTGAVVVEEPKDIHNYDTIVINQGVNYTENSYNFMGGVSDYAHEMMKQLVDYKGKLVCFNEKIDLNHLVQNRKEFSYIDPIFPDVEVWDTKTFYSRKIIVGDSHALSIYEPGFSLSRTDGKTLNGFLNTDTSWLDDYDEIVLYFGNIDMRFHIHRFGGFEAINDLVKRYAQFINQLLAKGKKVTVQGLIPIEDESRKLPGTGLYKGEKFYGTRGERQSYVDYFNSQMRVMSALSIEMPTPAFTFREWNLPEDGFEAHNKFYCMEQKQSVHLRPSYYLFADKLFETKNQKIQNTLFR